MGHIGEAYRKRLKQLATWPFWRSMIVLFCVASLLGHLIEWPYCAAGAAFFNSVSWSDEVLANPFKPFMVYGIGIVACSVLLVPLKDGLRACFDKPWKALLTFYILGVFLGMGMELAQGFTQNQPDANGVYPLWDVHDYPGNILGQAWIVNDLLLGAVFTVAAWHICPMCEMRLEQLNNISSLEANRNAAFVACVFLVLTVVTYFVV